MAAATQTVVPAHVRAGLSAAHLGAHWSEHGCSFGVDAPNATAVWVCAWDGSGQQPLGELALQRDAHTGWWQGWWPQLPLHSRYGLRADGPWDPAQGQRYNPHKLLLDPYAQLVCGGYDGDAVHLGHAPQAPERRDTRDNAASSPKAVVVAPLPAPPCAAPWVDPGTRVIVEAHLKAMTALHPDVPPAIRGRYAGLTHPAVLQHWRRLGVTTVCLQPLAARADEARLLAQGLSNHWGYNPLAWLAPEPRYALDPLSARQECQAMVQALHAAGLEVVLDVVFNHSAESDEHGPTLSLRGLDNATYYRLDDDRARYVNWAGCGNVLNADQPAVQRLILDALRHWVQVYGVDGFRFDLAPIMGRSERLAGRFDPAHPLLQAMAQDPVLRQRVHIAEPWDIGPDGYQLGAFGRGWMEWNDRFRDSQRAAWLHQQGRMGDWAQRLAGSSDVFGARPAHSSINYVCSHDGFTLADLVRYAHRHNHANGEDNRDGHGHNLSVNHGVEGPSSDPAVEHARLRQQRALLACTLLALGTPMLLAGDELGHSQAGNNNAYCQDNATTWIDWSGADHSLIDFVAHAVAVRQALMLGSTHWWASSQDQAAPSDAWRVTWRQASGEPMNEAAWHANCDRPMVLLWAKAGQAANALAVFHPGVAPAPVELPEGDWSVWLDSDQPAAINLVHHGAMVVPAGTVQVLTTRPWRS
jgi:glycogen debranching enzyme